MANNLNPMQLLLMLKNNNPMAVAQSIISQNFANDPTMNNILNLAKNGNVNELEKIARQIVSSQGKNYDEELKRLMDVTKNL